VELYGIFLWLIGMDFFELNMEALWQWWKLFWCKCHEWTNCRFHHSFIHASQREDI